MCLMCGVLWCSVRRPSAYSQSRSTCSAAQSQPSACEDASPSSFPTPTIKQLQIDLILPPPVTTWPATSILSGSFLGVGCSSHPMNYGAWTCCCLDSATYTNKPGKVENWGGSYLIKKWRKWLLTLRIFCSFGKQALMGYSKEWAICWVSQRRGLPSEARLIRGGWDLGCE